MVRVYGGGFFGIFLMKKWSFKREFLERFRRNIGAVIENFLIILLRNIGAIMVVILRMFLGNIRAVINVTID